MKKTFKWLLVILSWIWGIMFIAGILIGIYYGIIGKGGYGGNPQESYKSDEY